jgi:hypothetical protein
MAGKTHFVWPALFAVYCISVILAGCGNNTDVVIEEPQTEVMQLVTASNGAGSAVSRLRQILLLPVVLDINPEDPKACMDVCNPLRDRAEIALGTSKHLELPLGYDVTCLDFSCRRIAGNPYSNELLSGWAAEIANWANQNPTARQLPEHLIEIVGQIQSTFGVDGLAVVHGDVRYVKDADMLHWLATLTVSMYYNLLRGNTAQLHADIFATDTGHRLWSAKTTVTQIGQVQSWPVAEAKSRYGEALFGELDACTAAARIAPPES